MGEDTARRVGVEHLNGKLLGAGRRRAPLQAGEPVRAVAGELARERAPGKVRTGDRDRGQISVTRIIHRRTSAVTIAGAGYGLDRNGRVDHVMPPALLCLFNSPLPGPVTPGAAPAGAGPGQVPRSLNAAHDP